MAEPALAASGEAWGLGRLMFIVIPCEAEADYSVFGCHCEDTSRLAAWRKAEVDRANDSEVKPLCGLGT